MKRNSFKTGIAALAAALLASLAFAADKPNFVIIVADDSSPCDYGCYGSGVVKTPNIDSIAANGMRFDNGFVTASSCSPSRTSMLTGVYPSQLGLARNLHVDLPETSGLITLQGVLKQGGYYTGISGKTHIGKYAVSQFDKCIPLGKKDVEEVEGGNGGFVPMLESRPKDKPFFFWFASTDPHRTFTAKDFEKAYNPKDVVIPEFWLDTPATRQDLLEHYGEISRLDSYVGKVIAELKKQGVLDNTVIIYIADNGRPFPRYKTTNYYTGTNVPFLVMWGKNVKAGQVTDSLVSTIDIAPTLCELAGIAKPKQFEGVSFAPILKNKDAQTREYVYTERNWHDFKGFERAVRDKKYSYIHNWLPALQTLPPSDIRDSGTFGDMDAAYKAGNLPPRAAHCFIKPRQEIEFYDLQKDPAEQSNLAQDPAYADLVKKYGEILDKWMASTNQKFDETELLEDWSDRDTYQPNALRKKRILVPLKYLDNK